MREKISIWILAALLLIAFATVVAFVIPSSLLESSGFIVAIVVASIGLGLLARWRFKLGSDRPTLFYGESRSRSSAPIIAGLLVVSAFFWLAVSLLFQSPTVNTSLLPFLVLIIFGWLSLAWTSPFVQRRSWGTVLVGIALMASAIVWLIVLTGALNPDDPKAVTVIFVPSLALGFAGLLALATPLYVLFLRLNGIIK